MRTAALVPVVIAVAALVGGCAAAPTATEAPPTDAQHGVGVGVGVGVVCGDASWQAMGDALQARCASVTAANEVRTCSVLQASWATCPADIRPASRLRDHFTDELIVMVDVGGEWLGAIFKPVGDRWQVVAFDGGDIP